MNSKRSKTREGKRNPVRCAGAEIPSKPDQPVEKWNQEGEVHNQKDLDSARDTEELPLMPVRGVDLMHRPGRGL